MVAMVDRRPRRPGGTQKIATQATTSTLQGYGQVAGDLTLQSGQLVVDMSKSTTVGGVCARGLRARPPMARSAVPKQ